MKEFKQNQSKKHDEIQIWCFKNIKEIIKGITDKDFSDDDIKINEINIEEPIKQSNGYIVGYLDIICHFCIEKMEFSLIIEIKPEIYSLGDLIRQVKTYKNSFHNHRNIFVVVSKTDKYKEILKSQNIRFFKYSIL